MKFKIEINENDDFIIVFKRINDLSPETIPEVPFIKETAVQADENPLNLSNTAKFLGVKRKDMMNLLESQDYIRRNDERKPYAPDDYVQQGLFQNVHYHSCNGHHGIQTRVTRKGVSFIAKLLEADKQK